MFDVEGSKLKGEDGSMFFFFFLAGLVSGRLSIVFLEIADLGKNMKKCDVRKLTGILRMRARTGSICCVL